MTWTLIFHLGDLRLTLALGAAIAAWLLGALGWRAALYWCAALGLALGLVAASKIAFLGWATAVPSLRFRALSGHATGSAAILPVLVHLLTRAWSRTARACAMTVVLAGTAAVAVALVQADQHTPAEAAAGWLLGTSAAWTTLVAIGKTVRQPAGGAVTMLVFALATGLAGIVPFVPINYWMIKLALVLSGNPAPHPWHDRGVGSSTSGYRRQACPLPHFSPSNGDSEANSTMAPRIRS